jgi:uncharacterized protein
VVQQLPSYIRESKDGVVLEVVVAPRAKRSAFVGFHGGVPKVSLAAPPIDGRANEELVLLLKGVFTLPARDIELVRGDSSRRKFVHLRGISAEKAVQVLESIARS